jgi:ribosomal protein L3 glutamine methyltransferase
MKLLDASTGSLCTVCDLVRFAVTQMAKSNCFFGHGFSNAEEEATFLVTSALHLPLASAERFWQAKLLPAEIEHVASLIQKRCEEKVPSAYLTGETWYAGFRFKSDERALVPRSLLINALELLQSNAEDDLFPAMPDLPESPKILDLCTGGGSIAIAMAYRLFDEGRLPKIVGSDLSTKALALAKENIAMHELGKHIKLVQGDLFAGLKPSDKFDFILCNPPYVNASSMKKLPAEYLHEPQDALEAGNDGMDFIERLLRELPNRLKTGGALLLEIGNEAPYFEKLISHLNADAGLQFEFSYCEVPAGDEMVVLIQT